MSPVPTPTLLTVSAEEQQYRGFALSQLAILRRTMELGKLNTGTRVVELENGVVVTCRKIFNQEDISISTMNAPFTEEIKTERFYPHGFLAHPRCGEIKAYPFRLLDSERTFIGGVGHYGKGWKVVDGNLINIDGPDVYPLVDNDGGSMLFAQKANNDWATIPSKNSNGNWIKSGAAEIRHGEYTDPPGKWAIPPDLNYGNVDWKGPVTPSPKSRLILTFRGNPSRYWPLNQFADIPGLTRIDHTIESMMGDYSYTTPFSEYVYSRGSIYATMPYLYAPMNSGIQRAQVLGAAIRESDGLLVCVVKTCYNTYPRAKAVGEMVSTWQVYSDGILVKDWLEDKASAEAQIATADGLVLVEVPDPGRGYFIEVILRKPGNITDGWKRLCRIPFEGNMPNCNFFFSEDGTKACSVIFGKLIQIEIIGDAAVCNESGVGGFIQNIRTTDNTAQTEDESYPDPELAGSIFSNVYRAGVSSGDWIGKSEQTKIYTAEKSGTVTIAADYKGNTLVKMDVTLTGSEEYKYFRRYGAKWGATALPPSYAMDSRGPASRTPIAYGPYFGGLGGDGRVIVGTTVYAGHANCCKPVVSLSVSGGGSWTKLSDTLLVCTSKPTCSSDGAAYITATLTVRDDASNLTTIPQTATARVEDAIWVTVEESLYQGNCTGLDACYGTTMAPAGYPTAGTAIYMDDSTTTRRIVRPYYVLTYPDQSCPGGEVTTTTRLLSSVAALGETATIAYQGYWTAGCASAIYSIIQIMQTRHDELRCP